MTIDNSDESRWIVFGSTDEGREASLRVGWRCERRAESPVVLVVVVVGRAGPRMEMGRTKGREGIVRDTGGAEKEEEEEQQEQEQECRGWPP